MPMKPTLSLFTILLLVSLACGIPTQPPFPSPTYTPAAPAWSRKETGYGFFPTPPEVSIEAVFAHYRAMADHADVVLVQENIPWLEFSESEKAESQKIVDMQNARKLADAYNLASIYVIDPLNGLNRREFANLPEGWAASFANPTLRKAYKNFALRILQEFHPHYLGLASEINTYMEANPQDTEHFLSLYNEVYDAVKAQSPETQVFVSFQWEQLNGLLGDQPAIARRTKWSQVDSFEPRLDLLAISSYPFWVYRSAAEIPADYYTPLLQHSSKPIAIAESGFLSSAISPNTSGTPQDQQAYLAAVRTQLGGPRLQFWIYLLLADLNANSYARFLRQAGAKDADLNTLGYFVHVGLQEQDGSPKPALTDWDAIRKEP